MLRRSFQEYGEDIGGQSPEYGQGERSGPAARLRSIIQGLRGSALPRLLAEPEHVAGLADSLEEIANEIEQGA